MAEIDPQEVAGTLSHLVPLGRETASGEGNRLEDIRIVRSSQVEVRIHLSQRDNDHVHWELRSRVYLGSENAEIFALARNKHRSLGP